MNKQMNETEWFMVLLQQNFNKSTNFETFSLPLFQLYVLLNVQSLAFGTCRSGEGVTLIVLFPGRTCVLDVSHVSRSLVRCQTCGSAFVYTYQYCCYMISDVLDLICACTCVSLYIYAEQLRNAI